MSKKTHTGRVQRPTGKQAAFVQEYIKHPNRPAYEAVLAAGYETDKVNASKIAAANLSKKAVQLELAKYSSTAEDVLAEVLDISRKKMSDASITRAVDWAVNARQTADSILDRVHGKATTKIEQTSKAVVINIDLTQTSS